MYGQSRSLCGEIADLWPPYLLKELIYVYNIVLEYYFLTITFFFTNNVSSKLKNKDWNINEWKQGLRWELQIANILTVNIKDISR